MRLFENYPELLAAVSEREDGSCRLRLTGNEAVDAATRENRKAFAKKTGVEHQYIVAGDLVHGNAVAVVTKADAGKIFPGVDGIISDTGGIFLSITIADCLPIFLYDAKSKAVGLLHAGWRGLENNIIHEGVRKMAAEFGSIASNVHAAIGPGIGVCHFEVKDDVLKKFSKYIDAAFVQKGGEAYLDLKRIANLQLLRAGILPGNIETSGECTHCLDSKYFSYRRDKLEVLETMMAIIGLRN